jgi:hypothetical protein
MSYGSKPTDGGYLLMTDEEKKNILSKNYQEKNLLNLLFQQMNF